MPGPKPIPGELDEQSRHERLALTHGKSKRLALRARIVLAAAEVANNDQITVQLGTTDTTARLWRSRFVRRAAIRQSLATRARIILLAAEGHRPRSVLGSADIGGAPGHPIPNR